MGISEPDESRVKQYQTLIFWRKGIHSKHLWTIPQTQLKTFPSPHFMTPVFIIWMNVQHCLQIRLSWAALVISLPGLLNNYITCQWNVWYVHSVFNSCLKCYVNLNHSLLVLSQKSVTMPTSVHSFSLI